MSSVAKILAKQINKNTVSAIPKHPLNKSVKERAVPGAIGIEIELEGEGLPGAGYLDAVRADSGAFWVVKTDGSLRNGLEYVLSSPCDPEEVSPLINGLFEVFHQRNTRLTPSNRCSIHVHYNVGGMKVNEITSIIALWTIFEEPLIRWWGDARYKNHFCLSSKDEETNVGAWTDFLTTGTLPEYNGLRYTALNLVAIRKYGSLEFRGGGAVNNPQDGIVWATFLYKLCEYAREKYRNPQQIAYDLSERGPAAILEDICGREFEDFFRQVLTTVKDFHQCCTESFYNIQHIVLGFPWAEWCQEIDKPYVPNPFGKAKPVKVRDFAFNQEAWVTAQNENIERLMELRNGIREEI